MFASKNIYEHILRGIIGIGAFYIASTQQHLIGAAVLPLILIALLAFRGCPMCWVTGLFQTIINRDKSYLYKGCSIKK